MSLIYPSDIHIALSLRQAHTHADREILHKVLLLNPFSSPFTQMVSSDTQWARRLRATQTWEIQFDLRWLGFWLISDSSLLRLRRAALLISLSTVSLLFTMLAFAVSNKNSICSWLKGRWKVENSSIFALNSSASVGNSDPVQTVDWVISGRKAAFDCFWPKAESKDQQVFWSYVTNSSLYCCTDTGHRFSHVWWPHKWGCVPITSRLTVYVYGVSALNWWLVYVSSTRVGGRPLQFCLLKSGM